MYILYHALAHTWLNSYLLIELSTYYLCLTSYPRLAHTRLDLTNPIHPKPTTLYFSSRKQSSLNYFFICFSCFHFPAIEHYKLLHSSSLFCFFLAKSYHLFVHRCRKIKQFLLIFLNYFSSSLGFVGVHSSHWAAGCFVKTELDMQVIYIRLEKLTEIEVNRKDILINRRDQFSNRLGSFGSWNSENRLSGAVVGSGQKIALFKPSPALISIL